MSLRNVVELIVPLSSKQVARAEREYEYSTASSACGRHSLSPMSSSPTPRNNINRADVQSSAMPGDEEILAWAVQLTDALRANAVHLAANYTGQMSALETAMRPVTASSADHLELQSRTLEDLSETVAGNVASLELLMGKCKQLNEQMSEVYPLAVQIKDIQQNLGYLEDLVEIVICGATAEEKFAKFQTVKEREAFWRKRLQEQEAGEAPVITSGGSTRTTPANST